MLSTSLKLTTLKQLIAGTESCFSLSLMKRHYISYFIDCVSIHTSETDWHFLIIEWAERNFGQVAEFRSF